METTLTRLFYLILHIATHVCSDLCFLQMYQAPGISVHEARSANGSAICMWDREDRLQIIKAVRRWSGRGTVPVVLAQA